MKGFVLTRVMRDGAKRYDACWRVNNRQRSKTFHRRKDAERYLATVVKAVHEGAYQEIRPVLMGELFDRWLSRSLDVRVKQGLLKPSTSKSYRSMVKEHLRPAFGEYRSDRLTHSGVGDWAARMADRIAEGDCSPKFYNNLLNLLHAILAWARHPAQGAFGA